MTGTPWQPIETAPKKEYEDVLLYSPTVGVCVANWYSGVEKWALTHDYGDGWGTPKLYDVTHWAPLPEPPSKTPPQESGEARSPGSA
jgi:hypothetical protein